MLKFINIYCINKTRTILFLNYEQRAIYVWKTLGNVHYLLETELTINGETNPHIFRI